MADNVTHRNAELKEPISAHEHPTYETSRLLHSSNVPSYNGGTSLNWTLSPGASVNDSASTSVISEESRTFPPDDGTFAYRRRWYILLLFCLMNFAQNIIWNTWGPLLTSARYAFGWSLADVALQTNWGSITYVVSIVFFCWLIDVKGGFITVLQVI